MRIGWGQLDDGFYANPVLPGDYSDPDVIRVGEDYWMITSTFQYSPGMAILHSRDLISWRHVGAAVPDTTHPVPALGGSQTAFTCAPRDLCVPMTSEPCPAR